MPGSRFTALLEACAPVYLRNVIVIMVEMGLSPYRELLRMRKAQVDLGNGIVHLPESRRTESQTCRCRIGPAKRSSRR